MNLMVANVEWLTTVFNREREYLVLGHFEFYFTNYSDPNNVEQLIKMNYEKEQDLKLIPEEIDGDAFDDDDFINDAFLNGEPERHPVYPQGHQNLQGGN